VLVANIKLTEFVPALTFVAIDLAVITISSVSPGAGGVVTEADNTVSQWGESICWGEWCAIRASHSTRASEVVSSSALGNRWEIRMTAARFDFKRCLSLGAVAFLVTAESETGVGRVDTDGVLVSVALRFGLFDTVLTEGDFLAHADVALDAEVTVLASLGARLVACFLI
jgi:hypothetical protein